MMPKLAIAALVVAALALGGGKLVGATHSDAARVVRVVDGDTVVVRTGGHEERVRYIGVDTPESVKPGTPVQCFAKAASAANKRLIPPNVAHAVELRRLAATARRAGRGLWSRC
jgi:micrococcal nuclease